MSEYSIGVMIDGKETEVPSIVPTLTKEELTGILTAPEGTKPPPSVEKKAADYAKQRIANGLSPFAGPGEQQMDLYPDLKRTEVPAVRTTPATREPGSQYVIPPPMKTEDVLKGMKPGYYKLNDGTRWKVNRDGSIVKAPK